MQIIIVTGLSGSGKSIVLRALEDNRFYCIDNLPATLLPHISQHLNAIHHNKVAISIDSRSAALEALPKAIESLKADGNQVQVWFLESAAETLVKRFSETRRKHPLSNESTTLAESIAKERELLAGVAELGHHIDTSNLSANALRNHIRDLLKQDNSTDEPSSRGLVLLFTSFGFKNGIPLDADFVFDVRSLPNPHYDAVLKPLTGKDLPVQEFLAKQPAVIEMLADIQHYVEKWLPSFNQDNRSYLTVAIGCTGGQHRSVYFVEQLALYFAGAHFKQHANLTHRQQVITRHRELD
ncbi:MULTISPECIES: RNase adapter RapZ [Methylotenera]|uniref:RNase adapter RapZ n=1 Tax=Methylotenera TaxID=359407 RepID=UPI00037D1241|nr:MULTISPECIES: RNase adapter RapZ [Methylotenera]